MRLLVGKLLAHRYRVIRTLAKGGFGQTYIAEDTQRPGKPKCLVKQLKPSSNDSGSLRDVKRLFQTEAEVLETLGRHDQIPQLLAFFDENREFFLIQELIEGKPLTEELKPGRPLAEPDICRLLYEVLNILVFIHGYRDRQHQGIIHRDIKPENIIRRERDRKPVLVDFGSVKQVRKQSNQEQSNITINIGTPGYMPAEQARGSPRPSSDIYALGIIGIQAATGLAPNQLQEDSETGELLWRSRAPISDELAAILTQMTRYSFRDRYQSAQEVINDLEPLLKKYDIPLIQTETLPANQPVIEEQSLPLSNGIRATILPVSESKPTVISSPSESLTVSAESAPSSESPSVNVPEVDSSSEQTGEAALTRSQPQKTASQTLIWHPQKTLAIGAAVLGGITLITVVYTIAAIRLNSSAPSPSSPQPSSEIRSNQDQETFDQAVRTAEKGDASLEDAIQTLKKIPSNSLLYSKAQKQAFTWQAALLQNFLNAEVPKEVKELAGVIKTIKPRIQQVDSNQITISYDGSSSAKLTSDEGLRILTAAFMQRFRGNENEKIDSEYKNFDRLIVFPRQGGKQGILTSSDWDAFVSNGAKKRFEIYQKVRIIDK